MRFWSTIADAITRKGACASVTVAQVKGSAPREAGARMVVLGDGSFHGTIGGGTLEWHAIARAQRALIETACSAVLTRHALGPDLGQCCGGSVRLLTETFSHQALGLVEAFAVREAQGPFVTEGRISPEGVHRVVVNDPEDWSEDVCLEGTAQLTERFGEQRRNVYLFGAGHVGRALMLTLAPLPFAVTWVDQRPDAFPTVIPANIRAIQSPEVASVLDSAPDGAFIVVMTHSHPLDLEIVHNALMIGRFGYVGVIGSASKRARFSRRLRNAGLDPASISSLVCPIGIGDIRSKEPAAIAVSVAAELIARGEVAVSTVPRGAETDTDWPSAKRKSG